MLKVRRKVPIRRSISRKNRYQEYKGDLRYDFNRSCGYCDDSDEFQDKSTFHIDHFAPKSRFPDLELEYDNLVYSCRFCNVAKSNKWVSDSHLKPQNGDAGFVDPCSEEYDEHIYRDPSGRIFARTKLGSFMVDELNLGLIRHEYLWKVRKLRSQRSRLEELLEHMPPKSLYREELL